MSDYIPLQIQSEITKIRMLDYIPLEIQSEIFKKLPVKSLIQLRSVSKTWKSLIDSSAFIASYSSQQRHLLAYHDREHRYDSIVDDDTFPNKKVTVTIPVNQQKDYDIIGCSHGLLCLYGEFGRYVPRCKAIIWNISVRKAVTVVVPKMGVGLHKAFGFGVCCGTCDPKIVKITYNDTELMTSNRWHAEVFSLSTGAWRRHGNPPRNSIQFPCFRIAVAVDGGLYWLAFNRIPIDGGFRSDNLIISFDLTSEEFGEVNLPDSLAQCSHSSLSIFKLRESLVVHAFDFPCSVVWMMNDDVPKTFTKLFTINLPVCVIVRGFRKSGEPIYETVKEHQEIGGRLAVCEPNSKNMVDLGIDEAFSFSVFPYTETLLLLDKPDVNDF
ncbi:putative F-box domain-containing protein [Helianthus annuus]|uniref:F-box domain-containing protein n=1 Tax=Helianthus annuus TaxID=4232 RepID=A0A251RLG0_HELAN|nr:F-box protein At1g11270 [Helianthus annuus]XP_035831705.1 F-box protein At1g11270 [Helianthus annuus]KAF5796749.1 putative F-box domain-containing protein [Helianthus annuus]KAJ0540025.1 putative F-box domain-containing protein [Helianthus annuus]KAJ0548414.1 putative F-box domain-containing protein [Helianthus annuus]KAJ0554765.1 putative F-box domain-containing protein [Helianthus annuus]KAJ0720333.1 putative F-box domain-containing protein [Helianthus annuus]